MKINEESKELLIRKNQELQRTIDDKEKKINELESDRILEHENLIIENSNLNEKNNRLNYMLTKIKH